MKRTSSACQLALCAMIAFAFLPLTSGCASLQRSRASGYADREAELNVGRDRKASEREASMNELGLFGNQDLTNGDQDAIDLRIRLKKAERMIEGRKEREQYFKNKPYMRSDRDRLEFLAQDSFEARQRWLNTRGIQGATTQHEPEIQSLVDVNDITLGMTKQAVRDSWGEPELIEVAGNQVYGNERWHYSEQVSSAEGYQTEHRLVYFESGRVIGWETR